ncbi:acyl-CoA thioesterase [Jeotgalibacillus sp. S-D1]|uniref:acyl-CoA thioesterase n=1 Tax=Jeotgalibacillus sp. S-D1 TaxID=2552189 RepID=UPI00105A9247|nr:thioesterase family protein [Jeotgalibacillus sp. S-D1]TDL34378.1 acyl-CoA thioesterase [Jeotgalibacillus sp. S-D1]
MKMSYIENRKKWEEDFTFYIKVNVRFSETDLFGHLNNTIPFVYFEQARIEFLKSIGFMQHWIKNNSDIIPVVADLQCDFLHQIYFDQTLKIYVKPESAGRSSVDLHYRGVNEDGRTVLTGRGTMVQISKGSGKSHPWSEEEKQLLMRKENSTLLK